MRMWSWEILVMNWFSVPVLKVCEGWCGRTLGQPEYGNTVGALAPRLFLVCYGGKLAYLGENSAQRSWGDGKLYTGLKDGSQPLLTDVPNTLWYSPLPQSDAVTHTGNPALEPRRYRHPV
jgi:hypothetical protein